MVSCKLREYFPIIREREELLEEINGNPKLRCMFEELGEEKQQLLLDFCTGMRGIKILYDSFFKEVFNPEYAPERLESLLSVLLKRRIKIVNILPNDSTRIADESSLLITDLVVELEDGSLANVEIQKIGYAFPGPRSACYSSDMLLRQYKRVRSRYGDNFTYNQIKNVYLIVIYETSPSAFKAFPDIYFHHSKQVFDSGLQLDLLQEYIMIPLDVYHKRMHNKSIETKLEAWLAFLADDNPERIMEIIDKYPEYKPMYETLYQMCLNTERVMEMFFSEELRILDKNTVKYMIEEQQKEIDEQRVEIDRKKAEIDEQKAEISRQKEELSRKDERIALLEQELASLCEKR